MNIDAFNITKGGEKKEIQKHTILYMHLQYHKNYITINN